MKLLAVTMVLLGCVYAWADKWAYFFPESVTRVSCVVSPVVMQHGRDANEAKEMYIAEAKAERSANLGTWSTTITEQPLTEKGLTRATKACAVWVNEANRRVRDAAPIRVTKEKK